MPTFNLLCVWAFFSRISFESSFFSKSRLCTQPLKNIKNFLWKKKLVNNHSIPSTHTDRKITVHSHKHSFTPFPSLSPYSPTDRISERQIHLLHVGWRNFFSGCAVVVSVFWFWSEIGFGVTYVLRVQYSCGVVLVFWFFQEKVFVVTYYTYLEYTQYSCVVVSVSWLWREIVLKMRTPFYFVWAVSTKKILLGYFIMIH